LTWSPHPLSIEEEEAGERAVNKPHLSLEAVVVRVVEPLEGGGVCELELNISVGHQDELLVVPLLILAEHVVLDELEELLAWYHLRCLVLPAFPVSVKVSIFSKE
jgi:hypothetical protein